MSDATATRRPGFATVATVLLWVVQAVLAFQFAGAGFMKLSGAPAMVDMFTTIGAGQWLRYLVGALELAGAVGLLVPRLAGPAALGLVALMIGATITNLFVLGASPWLPIVFGLVAALVAGARRAQTAALVARFGPRR